MKTATRKMIKKAEILDRIQLRQSTIKDWLSCPLMFHYRHVLKLDPSYRSLAAIHGSALHLCIHRLHVKGFDQDLKQVYASALEEVLGMETHIPIRWKSEPAQDLSNLETHAKELLVGYVGHKANSDCRMLYSEVQFRLRLGGMTLTGTIDQVRRNNDGTLELVDLKSGMQRPIKRSLPRDWQLNLYAYALRYGELFVDGSWIQPRLKVTRTSIYFLRAHEIYKRNGKYGKQGSQKGQPWIGCEKPAWELEQFRQELMDIIKMMSRDWVFPNTASCGFCGFHEPCDDRMGLRLSHRLKRLNHLIPSQQNESDEKGVR